MIPPADVSGGLEEGLTLIGGVVGGLLVLMLIFLLLIVVVVVCVRRAHDQGKTIQDTQLQGIILSCLFTYIYNIEVAIHAHMHALFTFH